MLSTSLAVFIVVIAAVVIVLSLIPLYLESRVVTVHDSGSVSFLIVYAADAINVTDLTIVNKKDLANKLMKQFHLSRITIIYIQFIPSTVDKRKKGQSSDNDITQCTTNTSTKGNELLILFSIKYPPECNSDHCRKNFVQEVAHRIATWSKQMTLPLTFIGGQKVDVAVIFCSITQTDSGTTSATNTTGIVTTDIPCSSECNTDQACVHGVCIGTGHFACTLIWSPAGDGDLVLTTPNDNSIFWDNRGPSIDTDQGYLDRDDKVRTGPENIYWPSGGPSPPEGVYYACFEPYDFNPPPSLTNPISVTITVRRPLSATLVFTKTVTDQYCFDDTCDPTTSSYVASFTYP